MGYYHLPETQRQIARERKRLQPSRFDSIAQENRIRDFYQDAWKGDAINGKPLPSYKTRRNDSERVDVRSYYESAWRL